MSEIIVVLNVLIIVGMVVAAVLSVAMVLIIRAIANKNQAEERA